MSTVSIPNNYARQEKMEGSCPRGPITVAATTLLGFLAGNGLVASGVKASAFILTGGASLFGCCLGISGVGIRSIWQAKDYDSDNEEVASQTDNTRTPIINI